MKTMRVLGLYDYTRFKNVPTHVPISIMNEEQAQKNHNQSLSRLNQRGGMGILEILDNIRKRKLTYRKETQADIDELNHLIDIYYSS